jgi:hypothetical protein
MDIQTWNYEIARILKKEIRPQSVITYPHYKKVKKNIKKGAFQMAANIMQTPNERKQIWRCVTVNL